MNLKHIKHAKGTGASTATTNGQALCSPADAYNYMMTMLKILIAFFLFCYTTTCNYLNALSIDTDKDYPVGTTLENIIKAPGGENPYGNRFFKCNITSVESSDKVPKFKWWWQTTQETSYHLGGWLLHNYFDFSKAECIGPTEIPGTGILSFIRWMLFGVWTQCSMLVMFGAVFLMWIPGWFAGLFAFMSMNGDGLTKFLRFCLSALLTFGLGLVTVFPIFYEFFYLIYLFLFKRFISDPNDVSDEFTKRMSYLIVVFVIVALIVAAIQLPPMTAGAMAIVVFLVSIISHYVAGSGKKSAGVNAGVNAGANN